MTNLLNLNNEIVLQYNYNLFAILLSASLIRVNSQKKLINKISRKKYLNFLK